MNKLSMKELVYCKDKELWNKIKMINAIFNPKQLKVMQVMEKFKHFN